MYSLLESFRRHLWLTINVHMKYGMMEESCDAALNHLILIHKELMTSQSDHLDSQHDPWKSQFDP